jgi:hexosaminidase
VDTVLYKAVNRAYQVLNRKTGLAFGMQYITPADKTDSASLVVVVTASAIGAIGVDESYLLRVNEKANCIECTQIPSVHYAACRR